MKEFSLFGKGIKRLGIFALSLVASLPIASYAQSNFNEDEVVKIDYHNQRKARDGEFIVRLKQSTTVNVRKMKNGSLSSGVRSVDAALKSVGGFSMERLMVRTGKERAKKFARTYAGNTVKDEDLSNLFLVKYDAKRFRSGNEAIEAFKANTEVEYIEPNYVVYAMATDDPSSYVKDPLYHSLYALPKINMIKMWNAPKMPGAKRPVIAILDTGVDITHPDLAENIWSNELEAAGYEGSDDDANGFYDDLHGWDFVNQRGVIGDYNGHGTHCAGIAAAVGGNGIGIVGANPDALIMPVTILQSNGEGDVATIIKGIDYASANGADILSMSFGSYAESIALEQALGKAYQKSILVAAAGNDGMCLNHDHPKKGQFAPMPMFPAAYTFVLGVQSSGLLTGLASFSNYDDDGPIYSVYGEEKLYNYELSAPGVDVLSTYLKGQYKKLNGTSMACPLVAGAISRLIQCRDIINKEVLYGDLIHASKGGVLDIFSAYNIKPEDRKPTLWFVSHELNDTFMGDGDMRADAGETIDFYPIIRNDWGEAKNITYSLEVGENEDSTIVEFITNNVQFGRDLSSYGKAKAVTPIRFKVADRCVDGRVIRLQIRAKCDNIKGELVKEFIIRVENGIELGGMIEKDMTLYPDKHYIVTRNLLVPNGVTLTIKPGTVLKFGPEKTLTVARGGGFNAVGTPDSMIVFTKRDLQPECWGGIDCISQKSVLSYCKINGAGRSSNYLMDPFCKTMRDCVFENFYTRFHVGSYSGYKCHSIVFKNSKIEMEMQSASNVFEYSIFLNLKNYFEIYGYPERPVMNICGLDSCVILNVPIGSEDYLSNQGELIKSQKPSYFGSAKESIVRKNTIWDIERNYGTNKIDLSNMLTRPSEKAHGIVWKVVVNGYDAQDEFEMLPPLGVGKHKFEVYFNRPMKKTVTPMIAMGVRPPYTQNAIAEEGSWNADGTIYTAYLTISGKSAFDGLNRIYVAEAQDDENFEIPLENTRFNVLVQAAGSLSSGFMAEPGLGKVALTWDSPEANFDDMLGYNVYRYTVGENKVSSDTIQLNKIVLEPQETQFVDYDVKPGTTYYYYYKVMRTNLTENDPSKIVAATPLTAQRGDSNGSMSVDVADVVTDVAYLTNQNPQPFIFEAADVNKDLQVDILDVVGTLNIIIAPTPNPVASVNSVVTYSIENGILYIDSPINLGGIQLLVNAPRNSNIEVLDGLKGMEATSAWKNDNQMVFLAYSMSGKSIPAGRHAILRIGDYPIENMIFSDVRGKNVLAVNGGHGGVGVIEGMQMQLPYPNPMKSELTIPYIIGADDTKVDIVVSNLAGSEVFRYSTVADYGNHTYVWYPKSGLSSGIYFVGLYANGKLMHTVKVIKL